MRVVVAMMSHETNTFSPVPTPLESFGHGGPARGHQLPSVIINLRGQPSTQLSSIGLERGPSGGKDLQNLFSSPG